MRPGITSKIVGCAVADCLLVALLHSSLHAQQLSIRHYDVSDGLAHSHVTAIHQDSKGYLWFATWEGLSRFDGYSFINYGAHDGLGGPIINDIAEDREHHIWVATNAAGVARLIDEPQGRSSERRRFVTFRIGDSEPSNRVNALIFDSKDNLWCATDAGLYRAASGEPGPLKFVAIAPHRDVELEMRAFADRHGRLWFGIESELIEVVDGEIIRYGTADKVGEDLIEGIGEDTEGSLFVANKRDVFRFVAPEKPAGRGHWQSLALTLKPDQGINAFLGDTNGTLWIGTWHGLLKYRDGEQTVYTSEQGLSDNHILSLAEDHDGNLWIGTLGGGVCKLAGELIVSFTRTEGLPNQDVRKVIEDRRGRIYASVSNGGLVEIVGRKAVPIRESQALPFSNFNERILQDQYGDWWIGTDGGQFRFAGPQLQLKHGRRFTADEGITPEPIYGGPYEDPTGRIWISQAQRGLCYFETALGDACRHIPLSALAPMTGALRMISDCSGRLWLGAHGMLGRLINGRVVVQQPTEGLPETNPRSLFIDSRGWLWIGLRYKGVSMTRDPAADEPRFVNYSTANGLASDSVWAISEDDFGRMYLGTGKGLDQLDLASGRIHHFNTDDGLAADIINDCMKDSHGNIWVATSLGLSKFNPRAERSLLQPSPVYISRVRLAGEELPLPETGTSSVPEVRMASSRNNLFIEYVALSYQGEHKLRYQYKLEGVSSDWSAPTESRSINYAHLDARSYRFLVRAINEEDVVSTEPAEMRFRILPPIWRRSWFLASAAMLLGLLIYLAHRQRVARFVELERVRTRIATDLHDDIGANLSLIAMLSEVARSRLQRDDPRMKEWFSTIATTSRDTVDAMSDIVWAVNPRRDQLRDLTQRMRRFADDLFAARAIEFHFNAPEQALDLKVGADVRREVFLLFKESINNIVRHSNCSQASADLRIDHGWLILGLSDDGCGVDLNHAGDGHGLMSMQLRAGRLGGTLEIVSKNGWGTQLTLRVPVDHRGRFRRWANTQ